MLGGKAQFPKRLYYQLNTNIFPVYKQQVVTKINLPITCRCKYFSGTQKSTHKDLCSKIINSEKTTYIRLSKNINIQIFINGILNIN